MVQKWILTELDILHKPSTIKDILAIYVFNMLATLWPILENALDYKITSSLGSHVVSLDTDGVTFTGRLKSSLNAYYVT